MECPECNKEIGDIESLKNRNMESGKSYSPEFGQTYYWFDGEFKCPECHKWFPYDDSSL